VFAPNSNCGWSLLNCTDEDLVGYSLLLADKLIAGESITQERAERAEAALRNVVKIAENQAVRLGETLKDNQWIAQAYAVLSP
jgi:hypothetical protein